MNSHEYRTEKDTLGELPIERSRYWGCQTQRTLMNFKIGTERFPPAMIKAICIIKKAAAIANNELGLLDVSKRDAIVRACDEVNGGTLPLDHFPLVIWQSGSGTQTNMNVNEVLANRAIEILGGEIGSKRPVHPNDDVNMGQSSNDVIPSAMHLSVIEQTTADLLPRLHGLHDALCRKVENFHDIIKCGRTHLQDATPLTLGQEFSGYATQIEAGIARIRSALEELHALPLGGTAVGTGLNTHRLFAEKATYHIASITGLPIKTVANKFAYIAAHDNFVYFSGTLNSLATALSKIANDIRWLGSGPRCGIGELKLPANEPGSSIMPGKINPTQSEALIMICAQVMGNHTTISIGGASGNFELNVCKPLIIYNMLQSIRLLADGCGSFTGHCIENLEANEAQIASNLEKSLMMVTALNPHIGYDRAAKVAQKAYNEGISLKEAALDLGFCNAEDFDRYVRPENMIGPSST